MILGSHPPGSNTVGWNGSLESGFLADTVWVFVFCVYVFGVFRAGGGPAGRLTSLEEGTFLPVGIAVAPEKGKGRYLYGLCVCWLNGRARLMCGA